MNFTKFCVILSTVVFYLEIANQSQTKFLLVTNYLKQSKIQLCYFLTCFTKHENVRLFALTSQMKIRTSFPKCEKNLNYSLIEKDDVTSYGYVLDLTCKKFRNGFLVQNITRYNMRMNYPWLIFMKSSMLSPVLKRLFENVKLRMDSNVKLAVPNEEETMFDIFDIYNPGFHLGQKPIISKYGFWNGTKLSEIQYSPFHLRRRNMTSVVLRAGTVILNVNHSGTFEEYMSIPRHVEFDPLTRFHHTLFLLLENFHNFTHTLQIEKQWFGDYQNGTDKGLAKLLYEDKIDITCTGATQRPPARLKTFEYLMPYYHFRVYYFFRNPGSYNAISSEFLEPFTSGVWYMVIVSIVVIAVFLKNFHRIESRFTGMRSNYSWATALLITLSVIFQQDASAFPRGYAGRIAFLVLQILSLLLYNYYTSSIISSFLSKPPKAFHTLDELGHSNLEIGIEDEPYTMTWFRVINDSDVQYIFKHKVLPPGAIGPKFYSPEEGLEKVRRGGFAFHTQMLTGYPIMSRLFDQDAICDLTQIPMIPPTEGGLLLQKKSQYKELFQMTLRQFREVGLLEHISQIWEAKKPECLSSARALAVGINQVFMAFLILFAGMVMSLLLLVVEIFWSKSDVDEFLKKF